MINNELIEFVLFTGCIIVFFGISIYLIYREAMSRIHYEDYIKSLKLQGKYDSWKLQNNQIFSKLRTLHWVLIISYAFAFGLDFFLEVEDVGLWIYLLAIPVWIYLFMTYHSLHKLVPKDHVSK